MSTVTTWRWGASGMFFCLEIQRILYCLTSWRSTAMVGLLAKSSALGYNFAAAAWWSSVPLLTGKLSSESLRHTAEVNMTDLPYVVYALSCITLQAKWQECHGKGGWSSCSTGNHNTQLVTLTLSESKNRESKHVRRVLTRYLHP